MKTHDYILAAGIVLMLAACSFLSDMGNPLETPEPVVLRAASADGALKARDRVALRIGGEVKIYEACDEDGGILKAAPSETPFLWKASGEKKQISGWFRGDGRNLKEIPSEWAVAGDQDADEGAGMRQSDFLYAAPTGITYTDRFHARINFYHQTSKVMVRIKNEGALKDNAEALEGLTVGDESFPVVMRASFEEIPSDRYGRWTLSRKKENLGYVTPHETVVEGASSYLKYYEALVIPDNFDGKPLLAITLRGHTYYYVPAQNQARLTPGHLFIYDISVSEDSTKLVVTPMVGDDLVWTWDGDGTVTEDDEKSAELIIQGWIWDRSADTNVTSGVIPLGFGPEGWKKEGDGSVTVEEGNPPPSPGSDGWEKEGGDGEATGDDQPGTINGDGGSQWTKEGEDEDITSTPE
ncbi:Fimbrillin-like [Bacteroidales bacterium WCE2004]|nr:Fimbrillin-like [Bacteroidales bacterium WCE2004]